MTLFQEQIQKLENFLQEKEKQGQLRKLFPERFLNWRSGASLILEEDTFIELGHPQEGSLYFLLWEAKAPSKKDRILLVGPDINELKKRKVPFGQIIKVQGSFVEPYDDYLRLKEAIYQIQLQGLMTRTMPSRQTIWCRLNQEALAQGFSLGHLGSAVIQSLKKIDSVSQVEIIFITSAKKDLERLRQVGEEAEQIIRALVKMVEEEDYDCSKCEYQEVCAKVSGLKELRRSLKKGF